MRKHADAITSKTIKSSIQYREKLVKHSHF